MQIEFLRTGGFAGLRLAGSFDTAKLRPDQSTILDKLITDSGFFDLPEKIKPTSPGSDQFVYRVVISSSGQTHTISVDESVVPGPLRPLLDYLTTLATSSKK
jgi:hypothetical protein